MYIYIYIHAYAFVCVCHSNPKCHVGEVVPTLHKSCNKLCVVFCHGLKTCFCKCTVDANLISKYIQYIELVYIFTHTTYLW